MNGYKKPSIFVALSGGVDSSVAAWLLKKKGYRVIGTHMRCFNVDGCADRDAEDARRVAMHIGIPFYVWNFEEEYKKRVVNYMVEGYRAGLTPNPDVACNREIKFGLFLDAARRAGADFVATGHYVRLKKSPSSYSLYQAKDNNKDQSYFLWTLTQNDLRSCLFPIGEYTKPEVRAMAKKARLPTAEKKDSQGICFLGKVTLADFLEEYIPKKRGAVVTVEGTTIGEHRGAAYYTIGQRHGLNVGTKNKVLGVSGKTKTMPHYVAGKDIMTNTVVVAEGSENPALFRKEVSLCNVNFVCHTPSAISRMPVLARVRYRQPLAKAELSYDGERARLVFIKPQKFVAPGQSAVFYSKRGEMLGGGVIMITQ